MSLSLEMADLAGVIDPDPDPTLKKIRIRPYEITITFFSTYL